MLHKQLTPSTSQRNSETRVVLMFGEMLSVPICFSISAASSGVARGMTPGSLKLVRNKVDMTKMKRTAATTGMAGVR